MSASKKGRVMSDEAKAKISASRKVVKAKPRTEEHKRNHSNAMKGRVVTKEAKEKIAESVRISWIKRKEKAALALIQNHE
jgi:hypothetical protein